MRNKDGQVLIEGFYDHIRPPSKLEKELMKKLPFDAEDIGNKIGYPHLDMDGETYYHKLTMEPTFNINGLQSGYIGEGIKTIIPATATLKMDVRLVVDQDPLDIYNKICKHAQKHDPDIEVTYLSSMEPSRTSADLNIVKIVTNAVSRSFGKSHLFSLALAAHFLIMYGQKF